MPLCPAATCTVRPLRHLRSVSPTQTQSCRPRIKAGGSTVLLATPERQNGPSISSEPARREGEGRTDQTEASRLQKRVALILEDQAPFPGFGRSEEHTSELQSLMRNSYAVFCLKKKKMDTMQLVL